MSADPVLVSVITPVLNQRRYIEETLRSVLEQDYPNIEYIVIDGGSTDGTLDILLTYQDRIRIVTEPDHGQANAINKGLELARGDICAWLNSDDVYRPGAVGEVVEAFSNHPDAVVVYGDCTFIDADGRSLSRYPARAFDLEGLVVHSENFIPQPATFFRRVCLAEAGYLDEGLDYILDYELWLRFTSVGDFLYLEQELSQTRLHPGAKSVASFDKFGGELVSIVSKYFEQEGIPEEIKPRKLEAISHANLRAAHAAVWAGNIDAWRRYLGNASWKHLPLRKKLSKAKQHGVLCLERWGIPAVRIMQGTRQNPYTASMPGEIIDG